MVSYILFHRFGVLFVDQLFDKVVVTRCQARCYLFCDLLSYVLPDHGHLPHEAELRRMAVDCFSKPFDTWRDEKAPVHGQHYLGYYDAGAAMLKALP